MFLLNLDENKGIEGNYRLLEDARKGLTMCQACRNTTGRSSADFYVLNSGGKKGLFVIYVSLPDDICNRQKL